MQSGGTQIGGYTITREIGRGGMGVVYLARDTRLDRDVAIKALPESLAADPDRLARFQREAKVLASLNHPNVGGIHGLEQADGRQYLVLEYIEGQTLADCLKRGPIPIEEALPIARQIAEALEAAHEKGIVHRDLKPGNVMVTPEGAVKVLDFGLARTAEGLPSSTNYGADAANSPTVTNPMPAHSPSIPGAIMGTAGYMSPEQARGKPVDKRSDIFSFGCVLYEMLSGAEPFRGETVTDSLGAILHREPEWSLIPPTIPPRVRELVRNCLAKDRRQRLHDMGDARLELERAIAGHEWASAPQTVAAGRRNRLVPAGLVCAAAVLAGGGGWLLAARFAPPAPKARAQAFHVSTVVPTEPPLSYIVGIAPDARFVVYKAWPKMVADSTKPGGVLVVRRLDRDETKILDGTEGVMEAAISADGRWIAFAAARDSAYTRVSLKKLALDNGRPVGAPETLCDLPTGGGMSLCWSSDREIAIALAWNQTILAVSAAGGEPRVVVKEELSKEVDNWGDLRPLVPGKSILASRWALVGQTIKERTEVVDLVTGSRTPLLSNAGSAQLVDRQYVVARRNQSSLIAAKLDLNTLSIKGDPVTVWSGRNLGMGGGSMFVSANGTLAMTSRSGDISGRKLMWLDEQGQPQPVGAAVRAYGEISISPDGGRVSISLDPSDETELGSDLWIHDITRRISSRLPTDGPAWEFVWSRDGQRIAHSSVSKEGFSIWERRADGSGEPVKMYSGPGPQVLVFPADWSPDGKVLAIVQVDFANNNADVLMLEQESGSGVWKATPYLTSPAAEDSLRFSPDGKWVRFTSNESGRGELYVQPFTGAQAGAKDARSGRRQVSIGGANGSGWWNPDGEEIRYVDYDSQIMSVQIQTEPNFSASVPKMLTSFKDLKIRDFSFAPDGRVMVVQQGDSEQVTKVDLVVNFLDELRTKLEPQN
jgi:serine/threonine-protein kinase